MTRNLAQSLSLWMTSVDVPMFAPLREDLDVDVCVVGAGIAGLSAAYLLAREGHRVAVVTQDAVGQGETMRTTAHLTNVLDTPYSQIERLHGPLGAKLVAESHAQAIDRIEEIVRQEHIDCDFQRLDGYLFAAADQSLDPLHEELAAAARAGVAVHRVARSPLPLATGPCLRFPRQAQFHPLKFLAALAEAIERMGGEIYTDTHVDSVTDGTPARLTTAHGPMVTAGKVIVATDTPISNVVALHTKQAAYRTYVVAARAASGAVPKALYWDTAEPYHYLRVHSIDAGEGRGWDMLLVGGEDHKTGQADDTSDRYGRLETWMRKNLPMAGELEYCWSGQVLEPVDGLAFIGRNPGDDNVLVATGTSGNGMTYGMISGMMLADLLAGRENPWAEVYKPSRITPRAVKEFLRENLNVAARYAELITASDISSVDQIAPDSGAVLRRGPRKVAVYRDEHGRLYQYSAICTHLRCVVHWNAAEKSWDCPCHGSRFSRFGNVINGPATADLKPVEE